MQSFWDLLTNFYPFYRNSKAAIVSDPSIPVENLYLRYLKFGGYRPFLLSAAIGFYISIFRSNLDKQQKLLICLVGLLTLFFILYVVIASKIMTYHWLPFAYFVIFLSSMSFVKQKESKHKYVPLFELIPLLVIISIIIIQFARYPNRQIIINELQGTNMDSPLYWDIVKAADYLRSNLKPEDKVLPLDDVGNAKHSMMLAGVGPATYYIDECVLAFGEVEFPNSEYLHRTHIDYMEKFNIAKPRFVLDFSGAKHYRDLQQRLDTGYSSIRLSHCIIYQRKEN